MKFPGLTIKADDKNNFDNFVKNNEYLSKYAAEPFQIQFVIGDIACQNCKNADVSIF